jgi:hypothetical protein
MMMRPEKSENIVMKRCSRAARNDGGERGPDTGSENRFTKTGIAAE